MADARMDLIIVFDLDDTLYPETAYVRSGFQAVARYLLDAGIVTENLSDAMWALFVAGQRKQVFNLALTKAGVCADDRLIGQLVSVYRQHEPQISFFPDAAAVLPLVCERHRCGLLSDGYREAQRRKIAALKLTALFEHIVLTDELGRACWKPAPDGYERVMQLFAERDGRFLYVADNPLKDFVTARRLGWRTVHVRRVGAVYADAIAPDPAYQADVVIDTLERLPEVV